MKYLMLLLLMSTVINAEVYRLIGANGNVSYSDQPHPDAELIDMPKPLSYAAPTIPDYAPEPVQEEVVQQEIIIISPQNDEALWANDGNVSVEVEVYPELNLEKGEKIRVMLDGEMVNEVTSTSFSVSIIERGARTISTSIVNMEGRILATSNSVAFQIHRQSTNNPP